MIKLLFTTLVIIACVSYTYSENILNETIHIRVKRGKYYSSTPQRFYRRPPNTYPVKGPFSYTPPPGYMDDEEPYPGRLKVSRRPNEGLGDEDISNMVKYLSKQDLDKIIEFAGEKESVRDNYIEKKPFKREESRFVQAHVQELPDQVFSHRGFRNQDTDQKFSLNGPYTTQELDSSPSHSFKDEPRYGSYKSSSEQQYTGLFKPYGNDQKIFKGAYAPNEDSQNFVESATPSNLIYVNHDHGYWNAPLKTEESMVNKQVSYLNTYIHREINSMSPGPANVFTDSQVMKEEELPRPVNLRGDDFHISFTNNVPTVVKAPSYAVKNFGELPLMSNNYKLDTVSSYKVPHYTVTSNSKYGAPASSSSSSSSLSVPLEPAPPKSEAKEQSDAHLKAIKIWTHRSKGTAYTLHNDGTLSLELPTRPKTKYGR